MKNVICVNLLNNVFNMQYNNALGMSNQLKYIKIHKKLKII